MQNNEITCLVTGATGYIGTVLVKALYDKGYKVISLALPQDAVDYVSQYSEVRYGDVCDATTLEQVMVGVQIVVHLAGIVDITVGNRSLIRRVNVDGTKNVAQLCRKHKVKLLYCSSVHALPCLPDNEIMTEDAVFDPDKVEGTYGKTKAEATLMVLAMTKQGLDAMVFFPAGVYGPYERKASNIGQMIIDFLSDNLKVYFTGKYNFVDVRDVTSGICSMIENWVSGATYILSGHVVTVEQMLSTVAQASDKPMLKVKLPYWFVLATSYLAEFYYFLLRKKPLITHYSITVLRSNCNFSNRKAQEAFGFSPRPVEESLRDMTCWIMEHFIIKQGKKYKPQAFMETQVK